MRKSILIITAAILSLATVAQQEISPTNPKYIHKLGLHAGTASGTGLSYKLLANNKWMFQAVTLPIASTYFFIVNSGLAAKYKFKDNPFLDFYVYGAGNLYYEKRGQSWSNFEIVNIGATPGISVEYGKGEFFKLAFQAGYGVYIFERGDWMTHISFGATVDFALNSK